MIRRPSLDVYARGALAVDADGNDNAGIAFDIGERFVSSASYVARPADAASMGRDSSWLRAHGGMRLTSGSLRIGVQGGVDVALDREEEEVLVLVGSIALAQPRFSVGAGLTFLHLIDKNTVDDNSTLSLNITGDVELGRRLRLFGSLGLNVEDEFDGFSIGAGTRVGF